jgi:hypothetical protein
MLLAASCDRRHTARSEHLFELPASSVPKELVVLPSPTVLAAVAATVVPTFSADMRHVAHEPKVTVPPILQQIARCESGGDPRAIGGGGTYRGKYQFMRSTWEAVGGHGDPAAAPESEQDRRAKILLERSGPGQWPVCSR